MLVLTRKAGESICIGDDVEVRVVSVRGKKVRLAIEAPDQTAVRRKELQQPEDRLRLAGASTSRSSQRSSRSASGRRRAVS